MGESGWTARKIAGALVIAVGLLLFVEWIWVTDTEAIEGRLAQLGAAIEDQRTPEVMAVFSDAFAVKAVSGPLAGNTLLDKPGLQHLTTKALSEGRVRRLNVRSVEVTFDEAGDTADSRVVFNTTVKAKEGGFPGATHVTFRWTNEADGWRITAIPDIGGGEFFIEMLGGNRFPIWGEMRRYLKR